MGTTKKTPARRTRGGLTSDRNRLGLIVDADTSLRLGRIRQHGTAAELLVRRAAYAAGLRYRVANPDLPGSPDLASRCAQWAIFVHGCFWHRHRGCSRSTTPKRNRKFWVTKFRANVARDARAVLALEHAGFRVLTIWECEAAQPEMLQKIVASFAQPRQKRV